MKTIALDIESSFGRADAIMGDGTIIQFKLDSPGGRINANSVFGKTGNAQIEAYRRMLAHHFLGGGSHDIFTPAPKGWEWVSVDVSDVTGKPYCEVLVLPRLNWQLQKKRRWLP